MSAADRERIEAIRGNTRSDVQGSRCYDCGADTDDVLFLLLQLDEAREMIAEVCESLGCQPDEALETLQRLGSVAVQMSL